MTISRRDILKLLAAAPLAAAPLAAVAPSVFAYEERGAVFRGEFFDLQHAYGISIALPDGRRHSMMLRLKTPGKVSSEEEALLRERLIKWASAAV